VPRKNTRSRVLRQLAEDLLQRVAGDVELPDDERHDFVTALVRQWITYDGNATAFLGDRQIYLVLGQTPLGKPVVVPESALHGWARQLTQEWKISTDDLPDVFDQLNRGQSAEVVNADGIPLRLWVNPKERSRGVEPLVKETVPPGWKRDHAKIAATALEQELGDALDPDEMDELARSVARQWERHDGHACVFLDSHEELVLICVEEGSGMCRVDTGRRGINLDRALTSLGLAPEAVPEVIVRFNLGQQVEFRDHQGCRTLLWHDPKARRICTERPDAVPPTAGGTGPAVPLHELHGGPDALAAGSAGTNMPAVRPYCLERLIVVRRAVVWSRSLKRCGRSSSVRALELGRKS